jgi:hypothetical protein
MNEVAPESTKPLISSSGPRQALLSYPFPPQGAVADAVGLDQVPYARPEWTGLVSTGFEPSHVYESA